MAYLPVLLSFFAFSVFYYAFILSRYKKPHAARAIEKTKLIIQNPRPLHLLMGKIKPRKTIVQIPPA